MNSPNKITAEDFKGWVQERGLYFPNKWDPAWTPILSCNDPGEKPLDGGLLVAKSGSGYFIYTGLCVVPAVAGRSSRSVSTLRQHGFPARSKMISMIHADEGESSAPRSMTIGAAKPRSRNIARRSARSTTLRETAPK